MKHIFFLDGMSFTVDLSKIQNGHSVKEERTNEHIGTICNVERRDGFCSFDVPKGNNIYSFMYNINNAGMRTGALVKKPSNITPYPSEVI